MGKQVVSHSLLRQKYRSLFLFPSHNNEGCIEKTALSAFSTYLTKNMVFLTQIGLYKQIIREGIFIFERKRDIG